MSTNQPLPRIAGFLAFPLNGAELDNYARRIVGTCPWAEFVGIQRNFKTIADPLILLRHCKLRGSVVAVRLGQLNEFNVTLAVSAQFYRYHLSLFTKL